MADFTKEWIEHLKTQISGRMSVVEERTLRPTTSS